MDFKGENTNDNTPSNNRNSSENVDFNVSSTSKSRGIPASTCYERMKKMSQQDPLVYSLLRGIVQHHIEHKDEYLDNQIKQVREARDKHERRKRFERQSQRFRLEETTGTTDSISSLNPGSIRTCTTASDKTTNDDLHPSSNAHSKHGNEEKQLCSKELDTAVQSLLVDPTDIEQEKEQEILDETKIPPLFMTCVRSDTLGDKRTASSRGFFTADRVTRNAFTPMIILVADRLHSVEEVDETLAHELTHAYDHIVLRKDLTTPEDLMCSEVRAGRNAECRNFIGKDLCEKYGPRHLSYNPRPHLLPLNEDGTKQVQENEKAHSGEETSSGKANHFLLSKLLTPICRLSRKYEERCVFNTAERSLQQVMPGSLSCTQLNSIFAQCMEGVLPQDGGRSTNTNATKNNSNGASDT